MSYSGGVTDASSRDDVEPAPAPSLPCDPAFRLPAPRRGEDEFAADAELRLGLHIKLAEQAMMSAKAEALRPFDLTVAQYGAMLSLYYVPGQSPSQLARAVAVTPQTIGATLDKLAAKSLVTRKPSKLHRKVLVVTLTSKGERLLIEADAAARTVEERIGRAFSADERVQLCELLRRVGAALEESDLPANVATLKSDPDD
jgi:transcriptional regulator, MarR family